MTYFKNFLLSFVCLTLSLSSVGHAVQPSASSGGMGDVAQQIMGLGATGIVINSLSGLGDKGKIAASVLGVFFVVSELEKQNRKFFNGTVNIIRVPVKSLCRYYEFLRYGGESLSWNKLIVWRTRVMKLLSPLTKQTTVVDLSREKRLRLIDEDEDSAEILDEQWVEYVNHIDKQCSFMVVSLEAHLHYYKEKRSKKDAQKIKYHEEIAFYLEELKTYLQEIVTYSKSVKQLSALDKDRVKRIMNSTCDTFEHVATLVDADTAADSKNALGQLTIQRENVGHNYVGGYNPYGQ